MQPRRGGVELEAFGEAWELFKQESGLHLIAGAIAYALIAIPYGLWAVVMTNIVRMSEQEQQSVAPFIFVLLPVIFVFGVAIAVVICCMVYGVTAVALKSLRGEQAGFGDLFSGFRRPLYSVFAGLLTHAVASIGVMACYVGVFFTQGLVICLFPAMVDEGVNPIDALKRSYDLVSPHWMQAGLVVLVASIVAGLSTLCTLSLGAVVIMPLGLIYCVVVYKDLQPAASDGQGT